MEYSVDGKSYEAYTVALDIIILRNAIASDNGNEASEDADANGDGQIDSRDIILLSQYLTNYNYDVGESSVILGGN